MLRRLDDVEVHLAKGREVRLGCAQEAIRLVKAEAGPSKESVEDGRVEHNVVNVADRTASAHNLEEGRHSGEEESLKDSVARWARDRRLRLVVADSVVARDKRPQDPVVAGLDMALEA